MTGLKSGSGDDLWGDDEETTDEEPADGRSDEKAETETAEERSVQSESAESTRNQDQTSPGPTSASESASSPGDGSESSTERQPESPRRSSTQSDQSHSYIVRRAIQDKSVQFERDERLTFFVHDDVIEGERDLITDLESTLGRDVPKFDIREAVYRAALRNQDDVLEELVQMGYSKNE
ncbi:hypothetical protein [Halostagnicola bangensis]